MRGWENDLFESWNVYICWNFSPVFYGKRLLEQREEHKITISGRLAITEYVMGFNKYKSVFCVHGRALKTGGKK